MQEFKDKSVSYFLKGTSFYIYRNSPFQCNNIALFLTICFNILQYYELFNISRYHYDEYDQ